MRDSKAAKATSNSHARSIACSEEAAGMNILPAHTNKLH